MTTNWKNVNNWHWVEKNCMNWVKEHIPKKLKGLSSEQGGIKVHVTDVSNIAGDADLNQRKGKIFAIYDISLHVHWSGESADGSKAQGKIVIPEVCYDTDADDITFDVSVEAESPKTREIKEVVRKHLTKVIGKALVELGPDMINDHKDDVKIADHQMTGHPVLEQYKPKPPVETAKDPLQNSDNTHVLGSLVTLNMNIEFVASARDLYDCIVDAGKASLWTRSKAVVSQQPGSDFSFFDGNITGTITELVEGKKIVQKWRLKTWPSGHHSTVTMDFVESTDSTNLKITHADVPVGQKEQTERNWTNYYFNPIKATFGYGALL
ncbi:activator of Hsp90 ATPase [Polychytrium aggregatum]|uniref:activator of Hsp90 ATPase n=1 Tax=Polychytrium aggregatum TaxID=110093 RepID=UPI0022FE48B8|nr:activator of Hsp90 ATPase [Polychytrium aggregatum]KAI9209239.1 activator of Hsp90 ATPase [Polychytrium aggregatum]